jgi:hypothetical protein
MPRYLERLHLNPSIAINLYLGNPVILSAAKHLEA